MSLEPFPMLSLFWSGLNRATELNIQSFQTKMVMCVNGVTTTCEWSGQLMYIVWNVFEMILDKTHEGIWWWLVICRTGPILGRNEDFVLKGVLGMNGSCSWLTRMCETCLKTLLEFNISYMWVLDFLHNALVLKQRCELTKLWPLQASYKHAKVGVLCLRLGNLFAARKKVQGSRKSNLT